MAWREWRLLFRSLISWNNMRGNNWEGRECKLQEQDQRLKMGKGKAQKGRLFVP